MFESRSKSFADISSNGRSVDWMPDFASSLASSIFLLSIVSVRLLLLGLFYFLSTSSSRTLTSDNFCDSRLSGSSPTKSVVSFDLLAFLVVVLLCDRTFLIDKGADSLSEFELLLSLL